MTGNLSTNKPFVIFTIFATAVMLIVGHNMHLPTWTIISVFAVGLLLFLYLLVDEAKYKGSTSNLSQAEADRVSGVNRTLNYIFLGVILLISTIGVFTYFAWANLQYTPAIQFFQAIAIIVALVGIAVACFILVVKSAISGALTMNFDFGLLMLPFAILLYGVSIFVTTGLLFVAARLPTNHDKLFEFIEVIKSLITLNKDRLDTQKTRASIAGMQREVSGSAKPYSEKSKVENRNSNFENEKVDFEESLFSNEKADFAYSETVKRATPKKEEKPKTPPWFSKHRVEV